MRKSFKKIVLGATVSLLAMSTVIQAQTLSQAGKVEMTTSVVENGRGYGGAGNQDKSRAEDGVYVTVSVSIDTRTPQAYLLDCYGEAIRDREVYVKDTDHDGDIDMTDLFASLDSLKVTDTKFSYTTSSYGDFYEDVLGISTGGWLTYELNGIFCNWGTPDLYDEDVLEVSLYEGYTDGGYFSVDDMPSGYPKTRPSEATDSQASGDTGRKAKYTQYTQSLISNVEAGLIESTSLSDGSCYWQELRVLRFSSATDKAVYEEKLPYFDSYVEKKATQYDEVKLTAVNAMRVASVTGDEKYLDVLAHGYVDTDAFAYDKKAGTYAVDYILMALDLNNYATDEEMASELSKYADSPSVRDDLVYWIVNNTTCWGGSWFTYDTGAQNAQALVPYADKYTEVRERLDSFASEAYTYFMREDITGSSFDASSAGEVIRFLCMYGKSGMAFDIYNKVQSIGLANTKYKGNAMDITRMAIAEWGLAEHFYEYDAQSPDTTENSYITNLYVSEEGLGDSLVFEIKSNILESDVKLVDFELELPDGVKLTDVTSDITDTVNYGLSGNRLRVTAFRDTESFNIVAGTTLLKVRMSPETDGTYAVTVNSVNIRFSSELYRIADVQKTSSVEYESSGTTVAVRTLYEGTENSDIVPSAYKAVKINLSIDEANQIVLKHSGNTYNLYRTSEFGDSGTYLALVSKDVDNDALTDISNYYKTLDASTNLMFGDVDEDGKITSADSLEIVKLWVGSSTRPITSSLVLRANVTGDEHINNEDTLAIIEHRTEGKIWKILR